MVTKTTLLNNDPRRLYSLDQPLGPIETPTYSLDSWLKPLFDTNNRIYGEMASGTALLIGRKGAGKTAFMRNVLAERRDRLVVEIEAPQAFEAMVADLGRVIKKGGLRFVESVSFLWCVLFWSSLFGELAKRYPDEAIAIKRFLFGLRGQGLLSSVVRELLSFVDTQLSSERGFAQMFDEWRREGGAFSAAVNEAEYILKSHNMEAFVLLDSMEDFQLVDRRMQLAVAGLLKALNDFPRDKSQLNVVCCLPAELYNVITSISKNIIKDFSREHLLQWHARELSRICANRLSMFFSLHFPDVLNSKIGDADLNTSKGVQTFWSSLFPGEIRNRMGTLEDPLAYMLRHTQLLPRQIIVILNSVFADAVAKSTPRSAFLPVSADLVQQGVRNKESTLVREILKSFESIHPDAPKACRLFFPNVEKVFTYGDLQKGFRTLVKGRASGIKDFDAFVQMLLEIGAIGPIEGVTPRYVEGLFEYLVPGNVHLRATDRICVHPLFSAEYRCLPVLQGDASLPVYPRGSKIESADDRRFTLHG